MLSVVCMHLRGCRCTEQGQFQRIFIHADAVLAVIQHSRTMCPVTQGAVAMVADFKTVFIIGSGPSGRPFHIAKLHLVDAVLCEYTNREGNLQKPVQFFPANHSLKLKPCTFSIQTDILDKGRIADASGHFQNAAQAACLKNAYLHILCRRDLLFLIVGIDIPGIKETRYIFVEMETVQRLCCKLSAACLQYKGDNFSLAVHDRLHLTVFQNIGLAHLSQYHLILRFRLLLCRNQRNHTVGRKLCQSIYFIADLFCRNFFSFFRLRTRCKALRKLKNRLIGKTEGIAHRDAVFSLCEALKGFLRQFMAFIENGMEGLFCLLINSCNRGTGQNIVELMKQNLFPQTLHSLRRICLSF